MKIAFITEWGDPFDASNRSGVPYSIVKNLEKLGHKVIPIIVKARKRHLYDRIYTFVYSSLFNRLLKGKFGYYNATRKASFLKQYAIDAEKQLKELDYNIILSPGTLPIAHLKNIDKPLYIWVDALFANFIDYYPGFFNLHKKALREGNEAEYQALQNAQHLFFTSEWAAEAAINNYDTQKNKINIIPRGANLEDIPTLNQMNDWIDQRSLTKELNLLFIGSDWERKGANLVLETHNLLLSRGIKVVTHLIGVNVPKNINTPDNFIAHGKLSKNALKQYQLFKELLINAHFLFVPTRAEAFGIMYAEGNAYGLPAIGTNTGGTNAVVKNGTNGYILPINAKEKDYAKLILELFTDKEKYKTLSMQSYQYCIERFDWYKNVQQLISIIEAQCNTQK